MKINLFIFLSLLVLPLELVAQNFEMHVNFVYYPAGSNGTIVGGNVVAGRVNVGDKLKIVEQPGKLVVVKSIEVGLSENKREVESVSAGVEESVALILNNETPLSSEEFEVLNERRGGSLNSFDDRVFTTFAPVQKNQVLSSIHNSPVISQEIMVELDLFDTHDKVLQPDDIVELYIGSVDVPATIVLLPGIKQIAPGSTNNKVKLLLGNPTTLKVGQDFSIRKGGQTLGSGKVTATR